MSVDQSIELQKKLGLNAFGVPQATLQPLLLPIPEKPGDLPEEVEEWLDQYDQKPNKKE